MHLQQSQSDCNTFHLHHSASNVKDVLNEAEIKLHSVKQKIGFIAEQLIGEDIHQFHKAFTSGWSHLFLFLQLMCTGVGQ